MGVTQMNTFSLGPGGDRGAGLGDVYADKQLVVTHSTSPVGIKFAGEIDASNSDSVGRAISAATSGDADLHVDVRDLQFCDISGIRAFVAAAEAMPPAGACCCMECRLCSKPSSRLWDGIDYPLW